MIYPKKNQKGLDSGIKATNIPQNALIGTPETEGVLRELERTLITQVSEDTIPKRKHDENILLTLEELRKSKEVVIATYKTNSHKVISIKKYTLWVTGHLEKAVKEINRKRITEILDQANKACDNYKDILSMSIDLECHYQVLCLP